MYGLLGGPTMVGDRDQRAERVHPLQRRSEESPLRILSELSHLKNGNTHTVIAESNNAIANFELNPYKDIRKDSFANP